jgi:ketosteroid isomerase-like protein
VSSRIARRCGLAVGTLGAIKWHLDILSYIKLLERTVRKIKKKVEIMKKILSYFVIVLMSFSAMAERPGAENADLHAAIKAFDHAYANNDVENYFSFYADDATVYFGGARQDIVAYHELWTALMAAGGGVELNEMSDLQVQVMPGGDVAIATSFIDNRTRSPDGTTSTSRAFETDVWQKINGKWKIISLHYSGISAEE